MKNLIKAALTAAIYCVLTVVLAPISFGIVQLRISELLTVLPVFSKKYIPALTIGCFFANLLSSGVGVIDIVLGTLATFIAAILTYVFRKNKWIAVSFPVIVNGIIVGGYLHFIAFKSVNIFLCMLLVAIGEAAVTFLMGIPFINFINKNKRIGVYLCD